MLTNNVIKQIAELSKKPNVFERGTGNIWTEEYIAKQMLKAHLDKTSDGASRNNICIFNIDVKICSSLTIINSLML